MNLLAKHYCIIVTKSGKEFHGWNQWTRPHKHICCSNITSSHAETNAMTKAINYYHGDYNCLVGSTLYVVKHSKINEELELKNSIPCDNCTRAIRMMKIKRVFCSYSETEFKKIII
jgi:deoxycytidylate deaminase